MDAYTDFIRHSAIRWAARLEEIKAKRARVIAIGADEGRRLMAEQSKGFVRVNRVIHIALKVNNNKAQKKKKYVKKNSKL